VFGRKSTRTKSEIDIEPIEGLDKLSDANLSVRRSNEPAPPARREAPPARSVRGDKKQAATPTIDIPPGYKMMIMFSFALNLLLIVALGVIGLKLLILKDGLPLAQPLVRQVDDIVGDLQTARIQADIPLNTTIPVKLDVPVDQDTEVVTIAPVEIADVPAHIVFPGGGGALNTTVNLVLPACIILPVHLQTTIPLSEPLPVSLSVPVDIPLKETDLGKKGGPFDRLSKLLQPLVTLVDPKDPAAKKQK
jgi:hypothetical protein